VVADLAAALELAVELLQHGRRGADLVVAVAPDQDLVPAGDDADRKLLLDSGEVQVVLPEQQRAGSVVVEPELAA
jgi:hypothetical protein